MQGMQLSQCINLMGTGVALNSQTADLSRDIYSGYCPVVFCLEIETTPTLACILMCFEVLQGTKGKWQRRFYINNIKLLLIGEWPVKKSYWE